MNSKKINDELSTKGYVDLSEYNQNSELKLSWLPQALQITVRKKIKEGCSINGFFLCKPNVVPQSQPITFPKPQPSTSTTNASTTTSTSTSVPKGTKVVEDSEGEKFVLLGRSRMNDYCDEIKRGIKTVERMQNSLRSRFADHDIFTEYDAELVEHGFPKNPTREQKKNINYILLTRFDKLIALYHKIATHEFDAVDVDNAATRMFEATEFYLDMIINGKTTLPLK